MDGGIFQQQQGTHCDASATVRASLTAMQVRLRPFVVHRLKGDDLPLIGDPRAMRELAHDLAWPSGPAGAQRRRGQTATATPLPALEADSRARCAA